MELTKPALGLPSESRFSLLMSRIFLFEKELTTCQKANFKLFQTQSFADNNFEFDENSRKFSKWVENTVGKVEITGYEQFLLFPQCFQKISTADM